MREIKFRAIDKMGVWWYFTLEDFVKKSIAITDALENWCQFTGLHDKHGKEIYEGDILNHTDYDGKPFVVKWGDGHGNHSVGYWIGFYLPESNLPPGKYEIIGDIYLNPELLK